MRTGITAILLLFGGAAFAAAEPGDTRATFRVEPSAAFAAASAASKPSGPPVLLGAGRLTAPLPLERAQTNDGSRPPLRMTAPRRRTAFVVALMGAFAGAYVGGQLGVRTGGAQGESLPGLYAGASVGAALGGCLGWKLGKFLER